MRAFDSGDFETKLAIAMRTLEVELQEPVKQANTAKYLIIFYG